MAYSYLISLKHLWVLNMAGVELYLKLMDSSAIEVSIVGWQAQPTNKKRRECSWFGLTLVCYGLCVVFVDGGE